MRTVPLGGKKAAGRVALVDDGDYELVTQYTWNVREMQRPGRTWGPYAMAPIRRGDVRTTIFMHNLIMGAVRIDHKNGDGLDNQRHNLRPATNSQNMGNRRPNVNNHSSQYKGVGWYPGYGKWVARIRLNGTRFFLGYFADEADAARAYDAAALDAFGEFARLNLPGEQLAGRSPGDGAAA